MEPGTCLVPGSSGGRSDWGGPLALPAAYVPGVRPRAIKRVGHGSALPAARPAAPYHMGPVEDDAVPAAIEALARGEWPFAD